MIIIILAGGDGKRMNSTLPKVLHEVNGIPMIINVINTAIQLNPTRIFIVVGKHYSIIKETIDKYNYDVSYCHQSIPNGTGGAIKACLDSILEYNECIILSGDVPLISVETLEQMNKYNTCLLISKLDNPFGNGRIIFDNFNGIIDIREEKDCNHEEKLIKHVNCGIYKVQIKNLINLIPLINNNNKNNEYYLTDIIKLHHANNIHIDYVTSNPNECANVNTQEDLLKINRLIN